MLAFSLNLATALFGLALLFAFWRLLRGPSAIDRVLALDTMYVNAIGLLLLIALRDLVATQAAERSHFFEGALFIAMVGFVGTVGAARFLARGDAVE